VRAPLKMTILESCMERFLHKAVPRMGMKFKMTYLMES
jgi:hypothetical protein